MTIAIIGATGRVGGEVTRRLLSADEPVRLLVRDVQKSNRLFGNADTRGLEVRGTSLDDLDAVTEALTGVRIVFLAMGSIGLQGNLQRVAVHAAARSARLEQLVRLSVLNAGPDSLGINQRAHWNIDFSAQVHNLPYTTIQPAIFSASVLLAAAEIRSSDTWTGLADTGRVGLIDHRDVADVAVKVLGDPVAWGKHYELTGPRLVSWPEVVQLLSDELGRHVEFRTSTERDLVQRLTTQGIPPGQAELLVAREWALLAGENEHLTDTVHTLLGTSPRTVEAFLHEHRDDFG
jgi:NAD(P)H dehydrogenase (quinone)